MNLMQFLGRWGYNFWFFLKKFDLFKRSGFLEMIRNILLFLDGFGLRLMLVFFLLFFYFFLILQLFMLYFSFFIVQLVIFLKFSFKVVFLVYCVFLNSEVMNLSVLFGSVMFFFLRNRRGKIMFLQGVFMFLYGIGKRKFVKKLLRYGVMSFFCVSFFFSYFYFWEMLQLSFDSVVMVQVVVIMLGDLFIL